MTRLAPVLTAADLPLAELHALRLDGQLVRVDDAFAPIDHPDSATQRARAMAGYCSDRLIAEQRSAAWVWGAAYRAPRRHELCASIGAQVRVSDTARVAVREVVIAEHEVILIGGIRVTSPLRTAIDLLRFQPVFDPGLVARLLDVGRLSRETCADYLQERHNLPRKRQALARLARIDPVDVVHRVDAAHRAEHPVEVGGIPHLEDVAAECKPLAGG